MTAVQHLRAFGAILALAWPTCASAEHISTFWRLEPHETILPTRVEMDKPTLTERLLPIGLVALTDSLEIDGRKLVVGSLFFKVFNDEGKTGYCPVPGRRLPNALVAFRVPIMDQRPCLVDSDKDGRFDAIFYAFEQAGGLPTYRGSINGAKPLPSAVGFRPEDVHNYPADLSVSLVLSGKRPKWVVGDVQFSRNVLSKYYPALAVVRDGVAYLDVMNFRIAVTSIEGGAAKIAVSVDEDMCVGSDIRANIFWKHLPPGALAE